MQPPSVGCGPGCFSLDNHLLISCSRKQITAHALRAPAIKEEQPTPHCQVLANNFAASGTAPVSFR